MGSYFGRNSSPRRVQEQHSRLQSPISHSAPVLPPIPGIADSADAPAVGLGLDTHFTFDLPPSLSSPASTPSPVHEALPPAQPSSSSPPIRPQTLQQGRAATSPVGVFPKHTPTSPASPLAALSVPYSTTTAQAKPRAGNRPLPAESTVNGVPQHAKMSKQRPELHSNRSSKGKFNLLNPVNLLMRRRSAQAVDTLDKSVSKSLIPPMDLPDDYDPRIRGNVVHDFSAPRTRRTPSYDPSSGASTKPSTATDSIRSQQDWTERDSKRLSVQHTPVFVEHIDSDQDQNRIHAETLANNDFVARNSWRQSESSLAAPPFGRKSQQLDGHIDSDSPSASSQSELSATSGPEWLVHRQVDMQSPVSPEASPTPMIEYHEPDTAQPEQLSPPLEQEAQASSHLQPNQAPGLPRHMTSSASRFSFQIANDSIAEEKMLEERHKLRQSHAIHEPPPFEDDEYDEEDTFDEDAMYDHDEMEDSGPSGIYEHRNSGLPERLSNMTLSSHEAHLSMASSSTLWSTAGAQTAGAQTGPVIAHNPLRSNPPSVSPSQYHPGASIDAAVARPVEQPASPTSPNSFYFDDGMIEPLDDVIDEEAFDEDNFDDPSYLKKPSQPDEAQEPPAAASINLMPDSHVHNVNGYPFLIQNPGTGHFSAESPFSEGSSHPGEAQQESQHNPQDQDGAPRHDSQQGPLDSQNLAAYHNALAEAAHKAAADGKFTRQNSIAASESVYSEDHAESEHDYYQQQQQLPSADAQTQMQMQAQMQMQMQQPQMRQSYVSSSTHGSHPSYSGFEFGFSDGMTIEDTFSSPEFPSDEFAFDDSDLISAANSEALANDDEGFYSQEFGFYAKARPGNASDGAEAVNGGYFGAPGIEIIRQKSVKEPNLTPITERSEFSTRNSYIGPFSPLAAALPSPGFPPAHMTAARMSPLAWSHMQEDEMTLADLRRLKQGAFGSSSNSLHSNSSSFGAGGPYSPVLTTQNIPGGYFMPRASYGGVPMAWQRSNDSNSNYNPSNHSSSPIAASPVHASLPNNMSNSQTFSSPLQPLPNTLVNSQAMNPPLQNTHALFVADNVSTPKKTAAMPQEDLKTPPTARKAAVKETSPVSERQAYQTHSRSGSGADNITYVREQDSLGTKRWILERRRTSEAGLLELIGREVVEGGRI